MSTSFFISSIVCAALALAACEPGKARMTAPPSEGPDPILVPPASLDGVGTPGIQLNNQAAAILIDDAVAITEESTQRSRTTPAQTSAASPTSSSAAFFHVARAGETVNALAQRYSVDPDALARINGYARTAALPAGTVLLLPRPLDKLPSAPDVTTYTVVAGDTYSKLSRTYKISVAALMYLNGAKSSNLQVGDTLYVPKINR